MDFNYLFTSLDGRINRAKYWLGLVIIVVIVVILQLISVALFGMGFLGRLINPIIGLVALYPIYAVAGKRFQDRNKPAMYALIGVGLSLLYQVLALFGVVGNPVSQNFLDYVFWIALVAVGIWYLIELGILKGTSGPNEYGADPLGGAAAK